MASRKMCLALAASAIVGTASIATPASAAGCNGVVNPFVWYCAPWDNNNGPQYPYYNAKKIRIPTAGAQIENKNGAQMVLHRGQWLPVISTDGAGIVAAGAGN